MKLTEPEHFKNHEQAVLVCDEHGAQLRNREILYSPDFVINAGGLIRMASERDGFDPAGAA